jgi:hypothetical protein
MRATERFFPAVLALALFVCRPVAAAGQQGVRLTGYLEHQFAANNTDSGWSPIDYDRLRVDLNARAGRGTRLSASVVYQIYRGDTQVELQNFLPDEFDPLAGSASVELDDQHFLNHAYVALAPGPFEIIAGKQYLTWGAAWVFNPTELFRPKRLFEPTYEREGIGALAAKVPLGPLTDVLVAFVPDGGFAESGKVFRARHHLAGFDISALVGEVHENPAAAQIGAPPLPSERRFTVGGDVTGELFGLGVWAEATWSDRAGDQWVEATVGSNYTLRDGTLLLLEGFYNGRGEWDDPYPLSQWLARFSGDYRSLGKGMLYSHVSRPFGQLLTLGMSGLTNIGDGSGVLIPSVAYAFAENVDILFNGVVYLGPDGSEFGANNHGGFLRGRVYF